MVLLSGEMQASHICIQHSIYKKKTAMRIIHKATQNSHTDPLFTKSDILKLSDLYEHQTALFVNDYVMTRLPQSFGDSFRLNCDIQEAYSTRQSNVITFECCHSALSCKFPI